MKMKPETPAKVVATERSGGILLHPTSLPGPYGIGDLGPPAHAWIDSLAEARQHWWQMLPLGPTGYADSPYQCLSSFAGNTNLISPDLLVRAGLLHPDELAGRPFPAHRVDFAGVVTYKDDLLARAWHGYQAGRVPALRRHFEEFCHTSVGWLDDYALYWAIKRTQGDTAWNTWPPALAHREPQALSEARRGLADAIDQQRFRQFLFFRQWQDLRNHAREQGIRLIGDLPIFVALDSADVWAHRELFQVDASGQPAVVAGVPPDYFSKTGQLWGNPLYSWKAHRKTGYRWWAERLQAVLSLVDLVRLDHFRGFEAYWEIPADAPTAQKGRWVKGPGAALLSALEKQLGGLPLIAEDLGVITPEVEKLRDDFGLPGMRILQFAFGGAVENRFLPHNFDHHTIVYTGTHDNDTTRSWYSHLTTEESDFVRRYVARDGHDIAWDLIRLAWSSVADTTIVPLQDVLNLGGEARMNFPGKPMGNWTWRFTTEQFTPHQIHGLAELTGLYGREPGKGQQ
jgi:4-alpha-glucanotransferase